MASSSTRVGSATVKCDEGGTRSVSVTGTVTWTESYDSRNNMTCSNFSLRWSISTSGANPCGCSSGNIGGQCYSGNEIGISLSNYGSMQTSAPSWGYNDYSGSVLADKFKNGTVASSSLSGSFTISPKSSMTVYAGFGKVGDGGSTRVAVTLRNTRSEPEPIPPSFSPSCKPASGNYNSATFNGGLNCGFCPDSSSCSSSYTVTDTAGNVIKSGSGSSVSISTLQPNTRYNASFSASNGCFTRTAECSTVTLAGNSISDLVATSYDTLEVRVVPINGNNEYPPTHQVQVAPCTTGNWQNATTTNATVPETVKITGLTEETCYQVRVITTTTAGSYTGNTLTITTPPKGICLANFTTIEPNLDLSKFNTYVDMCYNWEAYLVPADITVYYRVKNGVDPTWQVGDTYTATKDTGTHCFTINNLFANQVVYETFIATHTEQVDWTSEISEFTTPLVPEATSDNCASLTYMTEYLCASVHKLFEGNKKIYANPYSLAYCDPFNEDPTHLTLWSRYLRLMHAYICILCGFVNLSNSHTGQYLVGELGWVQMLTEIVEAQMDTDGWKLATSDAIYKYIHEKLKQVWHYQGTVDILVENLADLDNYPNAISAIVTAEDAIYDKIDGTWTKNTELIPEDFGVWHINNDSDMAKAESAWYFWGGTWNNLDGDIELLEEAIKTLEDKSGQVVQNVAGENNKITVVDKSYDFSTAPEADIVYFVTEPQTLPEPTYYIVNFVESDGTIIKSQQVIAGTLAPSFIPTKTGFTFVEWQKDGETWDSSLPITEDTTILAVFTPIMVEVNFDLNGGSGPVPDSQVVEYGSTITLPPQGGISYEGKTFGGWEWDSYCHITWTNTMPVYQDMTLNAIWDSIMLTVAIRRGDDVPDEIIQIAYGDYLQEPEAPVKAGYDFVGWFNEDGMPFDFSHPITSNVVVVAAFELQNVVVTFNAQTLPPEAGETVENPPAQTITRGGYATEPTVMAENYIVHYWALDGAEFNFDTPISEDITLDAVWSPIVIVDFDADGGEPEPAQQRVPQGGYATKPQDPVKDNCEFTGWIPEEIFTVTFSTQVLGQDFEVKVAVGDKVAEPTFQPTRSGYVFKGWDYDFDTPVESDITIDAIWNELFTVTFDPGYEGAEITTVQVENGQTVGQPADPVNPDEECTFEGWKEEFDYDPENPTLEGVKAAMEAEDYDAFPVGTEIPDTYDGQYNPLIVAQYLNSTNNSAYGGAEGVILIRKFVQPISQVFSTDAGYSGSAIRSFLNGTYTQNCSSSISSLIAEINIPYYTGSSVVSVTSTWFLMSDTEVYSNRSTSAEGIPFDYWKNATGQTAASQNANNGRIVRDNGGNSVLTWLRSRQSASNVYVISTNGAIIYDSPSMQHGVLPACFIPKN